MDANNSIKTQQNDKNSLDGSMEINACWHNIALQKFASYYCWPYIVPENSNRLVFKRNLREITDYFPRYGKQQPWKWQMLRQCYMTVPLVNHQNLSRQTQLFYKTFRNCCHCFIVKSALQMPEAVTWLLADFRCRVRVRLKRGGVTLSRV